MDSNNTVEDVRLQQAEDLYIRGCQIFPKDKQKQTIVVLDPTKCRESFQLHKNCIILREAVLGRYHVATAQVYLMYGSNSFDNGDYENSIALYRTVCRIYFYKRNNVRIFSKLRDSLIQRRGLTNDDIQIYYKSSLYESTNLEKLGDMYRKESNFVQAIIEYKKAIIIERKCIDDSLIILPFLYRKICHTILISYILLCMDEVISMKSNNNKNNNGRLVVLLIDWNNLDCIDKDKNKQSTIGILETIFKRMKLYYSGYGTLGNGFHYLIYVKDIFDMIENADNYHVQYNHKKALECYQRCYERYYSNEIIQHSERKYKKQFINSYSFFRTTTETRSVDVLKLLSLLPNSIDV